MTFSTLVFALLVSLGLVEQPSERRAPPEHAASHARTDAPAEGRPELQPVYVLDISNGF